MKLLLNIDDDDDDDYAEKFLHKMKRFWDLKEINLNNEKFLLDVVDILWVYDWYI